MIQEGKHYNITLTTHNTHSVQNVLIKSIVWSSAGSSREPICIVVDNYGGSLSLNWRHVVCWEEV